MVRDIAHTSADNGRSLWAATSTAQCGPASPLTTLGTCLGPLCRLSKALKSMASLALTLPGLQPAVRVTTVHVAASDRAFYAASAGQHVFSHHGLTESCLVEFRPSHDCENEMRVD